MNICITLKDRLLDHNKHVLTEVGKAVTAYQHNTQNVPELGDKDKQLAELKDFILNLGDTQAHDDILHEVIQKYGIDTDDGDDDLFDTLNDMRMEHANALTQEITAILEQLTTTN